MTAPKSLPLEARRRLWNEMWDRLLQPRADEHALTLEGPKIGDSSPAPAALFDAGRMIWDDDQLATGRHARTPKPGAHPSAPQLDQARDEASSADEVGR